MKKITIIGAGHVGESTAQALVGRELCKELVLIDLHAEAAQGIALDIQESAALLGFDTRVSGGSDTEMIVGSDLVIVSAGLPRKPGMSRADLLDTNLPIIRSIVDDIVRYAPEAMLLMVTNPVDLLTFHAWRHTGWERHRIFGLSGVLDSTRMASFVAIETGFSVKDITALVLGGHGDAMVPLPHYTCINGVPIDQFLAPDVIARLVERTRKAGAEILALREVSSAYNSPAASIATMVDAVVFDRRRILPCVSILDGEYGEREIAMGVPVVLSASGIEKVVELALTDDENKALALSAAQLRASIARGKMGSDHAK